MFAQYAYASGYSAVVAGETWPLACAWDVGPHDSGMPEPLGRSDKFASQGLHGSPA